MLAALAFRGRRRSGVPPRTARGRASPRGRRGGCCGTSRRGTSSRARISRASSSSTWAPSARCWASRWASSRPTAAACTRARASASRARAGRSSSTSGSSTRSAVRAPAAARRAALAAARRAGANGGTRKAPVTLFSDPRPHVGSLPLEGGGRAARPHREGGARLRRHEAVRLDPRAARHRSRARRRDRRLIPRAEEARGRRSRARVRGALRRGDGRGARGRAGPRARGRRERDRSRAHEGRPRRGALPVRGVAPSPSASPSPAPTADVAGAALEIKHTLRVPATAPPTTPYWLDAPPEAGLYHAAAKLIGAPENEPALRVTFGLTIAGRAFVIERAVHYKWTDPVMGERTRPVEITPAVSVRPDSTVLMFPRRGTARARRALERGRVGRRGRRAARRVPAGWLVEPAAAPFLARPEGRRRDGDLPRAARGQGARGRASCASRPRWPVRRTCAASSRSTTSTSRSRPGSPTPTCASCP